MPASANDVVPSDDNVNNNSVSSAPASDPKKAQLLKDRAAKIFKQHMEIVKLREELAKASEEKKQIEEELKSRTDEVYEMNQKMIFLEFQKQQADIQQLSSVANNATQDLKEKIERMEDQNLRRVFDMQKLKKSLNRLKNELYYFKLSKNLKNKAKDEPASNAKPMGEGTDEVDKEK